MKAFFSTSCAILLAAGTLSGCATGGRGGGVQPGIDVTKTHLGQPIARGQISVEAFDKADANNVEFQSYASAVARQLARLGWTVVPNPQSEQVALIDVQQGSRAALAQPPSPAPAPPAASTDTVATQLSVRLKRRSEGTIFWQGRALAEAQANTAEAQRTAAVERLAEALFRDFPGESGRTIRLR